MKRTERPDAIRTEILSNASFQIRRKKGSPNTLLIPNNVLLMKRLSELTITEICQEARANQLLNTSEGKPQPMNRPEPTASADNVVRT